MSEAREYLNTSDEYVSDILRLAANVSRPDRKGTRMWRCNGC